MSARPERIQCSAPLGTLAQTEIPTPSPETLYGLPSVLAAPRTLPCALHRRPSRRGISYGLHYYLLLTILQINNVLIALYPFG